MLRNSNVICRVMNSMKRPVNMDRFEAFLKKAYLHRVKSFPWATVPDAVHNAYAHTFKKMRRIGGFGLGQLRYKNELYVQCTYWAKNGKIVVQLPQ